MFLKTSRKDYLFAWVFVALVFSFCVKVEAQPQVRLDVKKTTQKKVSLAITEFVFKGDGTDSRGMGKEARSVLEKDLQFLLSRTDLEEETIIEVVNILKQEFDE